MITSSRDTAIKKITEMSEIRVSKVLIFMAGMEAEHVIDEGHKSELPCKPPEQNKQ